MKRRSRVWRKPSSRGGGRRHVLAAILALSTAALLSGCAVGGTGVILGRVTPVSGGWVLETYTLGAHLRTADGDRGLDLGAARRTYVFRDDGLPAPAGGWHPLVVPRVEVETAVLRHSETIGVDLRVAHPQPGVTLGFQRSLFAPSSSGDAFLSLRFVPGSPSETCMSTQREVPC
jgi:hypothetical protein